MARVAATRSVLVVVITAAPNGTTEATSIVAGASHTWTARFRAHVRLVTVVRIRRLWCLDLVVVEAGCGEAENRVGRPKDCVHPSVCCQDNRLGNRDWSRAVAGQLRVTTTSGDCDEVGFGEDGHRRKARLRRPRLYLR